MRGRVRDRKDGEAGAGFGDREGRREKMTQGEGRLMRKKKEEKKRKKTKREKERNEKKIYLHLKKN